MSTFRVFFLSQTGGQLYYQSFIFPGGEIAVKLDAPHKAQLNNRIDIYGNIESANDILELMLLVDAIRRAALPIKQQFRVTIPYFPYARQDRVMIPGESLSVKVMADLINSLDFEQVTIWDAHSEVAPALLNNCRVMPQSIGYRGFTPQDYSVLVAPDAGAMKKAHKVAQMHGLQLIHAEKVRDVATGDITGTKVYLDGVDPVKVNSFLIVDDICDGGRTFIELGKEIRKTYPKAKIGLFVTHGIFSKGLEVFEGIIDNVYCPNVFRNVKDHPLLTRLA